MNVQAEGTLGFCSGGLEGDQDSLETLAPVGAPWRHWPRSAEGRGRVSQLQLVARRGRLGLALGHGEPSLQESQTFPYVLVLVYFYFCSGFLHYCLSGSELWPVPGLRLAPDPPESDLCVCVCVLRRVPCRPTSSREF